MCCRLKLWKKSKEERIIFQDLALWHFKVGNLFALYNRYFNVYAYDIDLLNKLDQIVVYTLPLKSNDVEIGEVIIGVQLTRNK